MEEGGETYDTQQGLSVISDGTLSCDFFQCMLRSILTITKKLNMVLKVGFTSSKSYVEEVLLPKLQDECLSI